MWCWSLGEFSVGLLIVAMNHHRTVGHRRDSMKSGCNELSTSEIAQCGCIPLEISWNVSMRQWNTALHLINSKASEWALNYSSSSVFMLCNFALNDNKLRIYCIPSTSPQYQHSAVDRNGIVKCIEISVHVQSKSGFKEIKESHSRFFEVRFIGDSTR